MASMNIFQIIQLLEKRWERWGALYLEFEGSDH